MNETTIQLKIDLDHARVACAVAANEWYDKWNAKSDDEVIAAVFKHCKTWGIKSMAIVDKPEYDGESRWLKAERQGVTTYSEGYAQCPDCDERVFLGWKMNFCPMCGNPMKGIKK